MLTSVPAQILARPPSLGEIHPRDGGRRRRADNFVGRLIAAQLYGVRFWDPLALAVAAGALAVCAFFAALIPAARAASISPMSALRTD